MFVNFNILNQLGSPAINSNTFANRPAAGQTGRLFVSTDTFEIYRDNGTTWDLIGGPGSSTITGTGTATQVAYFTSSQAIGSSANLFWDNTNTRLGIGTSTPGVRLDIHGTGNMLHINSTSATANALMSFQRTGTNVWRLGDQYNGGSNFFELHNTSLANNAIQVLAASNEATLLSVKTYTTGNAIGVAVQHNLTIPNAVNVGLAAIGGLNSNLNLTLGGSTTVAATGRQGLEGSTSISFTGAGTLTMTQGSTVRAFSALSSVYSFNGSAVGTITHLAGLRICFPDNPGSAVNITNNYALLINNQTTGTGTITYTNRWGLYQEGASDLNYFAANTLIGTTVNAGYKLDVNGDIRGQNLYVTSNSENTKISNTKPVGGAGQNVFFGNGGANVVFTTVDTGSYNTGIGWGSLSLLTTGYRNVAIGQVALEQLTTGYNNVAIGDNCGRFYTPNIALTNAIECIFIGRNTQASADNITNEIVIGANAIGLGSNSITLGNSSITKTYLRGEVLINTTTDSGPYNLQVNGAGYFSGSNNLLIFYSASSAIYSQWTQSATGTSSTDGLRIGLDASSNGIIDLNEGTALITSVNGSERMRITSGGNVLIGTTTDAGQKLQVNGDIKIGYTKTASGNTGSINNATATTMFAITGSLGLWLVACNLPAGNGSPALYTAFATIVVDGTTNPRIVSNDGTLLTITLSGTNVQVTQTSGGAQAGGVDWVYQKIG